MPQFESLLSYSGIFVVLKKSCLYQRRMLEEKTDPKRATTAAERGRGEGCEQFSI